MKRADRILLEELEQIDLLNNGVIEYITQSNKSLRGFREGKCPSCKSSINKIGNDEWFCMHCLTEFNKQGRALEPIY